MIMVRKNELACRDEWAHDLWEPKSAQAGAPASTQFTDRKERPATEAEIAALLAANSTQPNQAPVDAGQNDIVLSELGPGPEPLSYVERVEPSRPWATANSRSAEPAESASANNEMNTRGAIFRAREAYRERSRQEAARSQLTARLATDAQASAGPVLSYPVVAHEELAIDPPASSLDQPWPEPDSLPEPAPVSTGDEYPDPINEPPPGVAAELEIEPHTTELAEPESVRSSWTDEIVAAASELDALATREAPVAAPASETAAVLSHDLDDRYNLEYEDDPAGSSAADSGIDWQAGSPSTGAAEPDYLAERDHPRPERRPAADRPSFWSRSGPFANRFRQYEDPVVESESEFENGVAYDNIDSFADVDLVAEARPLDDEADLTFVPDEDGFDEEPREDVVADDASPWKPVIPLRPALSAHLPRICRTCRDFRPAETSDRGWCANQWAFSHRRVVAAEEQAPCDSVLGDWWLPADEVWSDAADVSSHGQPTPLLDAWLPDSQESVSSRRRS